MAVSESTLRVLPGNAHLLGILIDDATHFAQRDLLERYLLRPGVLRAFGWRVAQVFTKDWHHDPVMVLRQIDDALDGIAPEPIEVEEAQEVMEIVPPAAEPPHIIANKTDGDEIPAPVSARPPPVTVPVSVVVRGTPGAASVPRCFTCTEDGSSKFWEVAVNGSELSVRFGRIGTKGQTQTKVFTTPEAALCEHEKLIRSKMGKGYVERAAS